LKKSLPYKVYTKIQLIEPRNFFFLKAGLDRRSRNSYRREFEAATKQVVSFEVVWFLAEGRLKIRVLKS